VQRAAAVRQNRLHSSGTDSSSADVSLNKTLNPCQLQGCSSEADHDLWPLCRGGGKMGTSPIGLIMCHRRIQHFFNSQNNSNKNCFETYV